MAKLVRKKANPGTAGPPQHYFSPEQIAEVEVLASVLNRTQIANYFGIGDETFKNIRERQPELDEAWLRGRANQVRLIGKSLVQRALQGDFKAQRFYLAVQAGWTEKVDHVSSDGSMTPKTITRVIVDPKRHGD